MNTTIDRPRLLIGALLVLLGALYLLSNIGLLRGVDVWGIVWGAFWMWLGAVVVGPRGRGVGAGRLTVGLALVVVGVVSVANSIGLINFSVGYLFSLFWPLILVSLGLAILLDANRRASTVAAPSSPERIEHDMILGDLKLNQAGWQLRNVRASTIIGDIEIDLVKARIPDGETTIDLRAVIGDIDIRAPTDLPVALDLQCTFVSVTRDGRKQDIILRRYTNAPPDYDSAPRRVRIRASLVFGDLNLSRAR
jgi:predicted membrane protein